MRACDDARGENLHLLESHHINYFLFVSHEWLELALKSRKEKIEIKL